MTKDKAKLSREIFALRKKGYTFAEIAKKLDVSLSAVYIQTRELRKQHGEESIKLTHTKRQLDKIKEVESLAKKGYLLKRLPKNVNFRKIRFINGYLKTTNSSTAKLKLKSDQLQKSVKMQHTIKSVSLKNTTKIQMQP